jgi:phage terminase large subunit GpA-like protein
VLRQSWGPRAMAVRFCVIDSRHRRAEVLDFARPRQPLVRMIAGVERTGELAVPFGAIKVDKHPRTGAALPNSLMITTIAVAIFKDLVASRLENAKLHLPSDLSPELLRQLSSEHKVRERSGSRMRMRWVLKPGHQRNELWDLVVYLAAAARLCRLDRTLRSAAPAMPAQPPMPAPQKRRPAGPGVFRGIGR